MGNELEDTSLVIFMILLKQRKLMTSLQGSWRTTKGLRFTTRGLMIFAKHLTYLRYFNHESASKQLLQKKENLVSEAGRMAIFLHVSYDSVPEAIDLVVEVLCKLIISDGNSAVIFSNLHMFMVFSCPQILRRKNSSNIYKVVINNIKHLTTVANAEGITERLTDLLNTKIEELDLPSLTNMIRVARKYLNNLVKGIEEGLVSK